MQQTLELNLKLVLLRGPALWSPGEMSCDPDSLFFFILVFTVSLKQQRLLLFSILSSGLCFKGLQLTKAEMQPKPEFNFYLELFVGMSSQLCVRNGVSWSVIVSVKASP